MLIGIIGAMSEEVNGLISKLSEHVIESCSGMDFHRGKLFGKEVVIVKCGVGKVFAAISAQTMIIKYSPSLIINTGVGGALDPTLSRCDIVAAQSLCQHDMDTSALGDPKGFVSGIEKVYFEADARAVDILLEKGAELGITVKKGIIASGDVFVATDALRKRIVSDFSAQVCEMEGAAIAQTAYVNGVPFSVIRAVSDGADDGDAARDAGFLRRFALYSR